MKDTSAYLLRAMIGPFQLVFHSSAFELRVILAMVLPPFLGMGAAGVVRNCADDSMASADYGAGPIGRAGLGLRGRGRGPSSLSSLSPAGYGSTAPCRSHPTDLTR